jgi:transglutaminase-like putative cysteine protease
MKRLKIQHLTEYIFPTTVTLQQHQLLLRPREGHDLRIESSILNISPAYQIKWYRDVFDNSRATVTFSQPSDKLTIASEVVIQHYEEAPLDFWIDDYAVNYPFSYAQADWEDLAAFQRPSYENDQHRVTQWLTQLGLKNVSIKTFELLTRMNQAIFTQFRYQIREEPGVQTPTTTLNNGSGSCRDYATLFIEACRNLGLASRFVSGYLHAPATEAGNASTHAWAEVYLPGTGWKGFDPTTGEVTGTHHIAVAVSRDPEAIPPVAGSFIGPNLQPRLVVAVQVNLLSG